MYTMASPPAHNTRKLHRCVLRNTNSFIALFQLGGKLDRPRVVLRCKKGYGALEAQPLTQQLARHKDWQHLAANVVWSVPQHKLSDLLQRDELKVGNAVPGSDVPRLTEDSSPNPRVSQLVLDHIYRATTF